MRKAAGALAALAALTALVFAIYRYFSANAPKPINQTSGASSSCGKANRTRLTLCLPDEVLIMIFELLDTKALVAYQSTCKTWNQISGPKIHH